MFAGRSATTLHGYRLGNGSSLFVCARSLSFSRSVLCECLRFDLSDLKTTKLKFIFSALTTSFAPELRQPAVSFDFASTKCTSAMRRTFIFDHR